MKRVDCQHCTHFRAAPYEARKDGCYLQKNMPSKQKDMYLDEQQIAGDHRAINIRGDCPDFEARAVDVPWWRRLWSLGA